MKFNLLDYLSAGLKAYTFRDPMVNRLVAPTPREFFLSVFILELVDFGLSYFTFSKDYDYRLSMFWYQWWSVGFEILFFWWLLQRQKLNQIPVTLPVWLLLICTVFFWNIFLVILLKVIYNVAIVIDAYQTLWPWYEVFTSLWDIAQLWTYAAMFIISCRVTDLLSRKIIALMFICSMWLVTHVFLFNDGVWHLKSQADDTNTNKHYQISQADFESQQALLTSALDITRNNNTESPRLWAISYAPYASEDVFRKESLMLQEVLSKRFSIYPISLVNSYTHKQDFAWATPLNLEKSINTIAKAMNPERDVLFIYLTSHGGSDGKLSSQFWPLTEEDLTAQKLSAYLDKAGVRHALIAVSACYSGTWIAPLQHPNRMIMTAADADHTSYGCGRKSELTYFGRAVFDEGLRKTGRFSDSFLSAVPVIKAREVDAKKEDGFSNPQIYIGENIKVVLYALEALAASRAP